MLLASDDNHAQTARDAGVHVPELAGYCTEQPPLADHLLLVVDNDKPRRPDWLSFRQLGFCRGKAGEDTPAGGVAVDWSSVCSIAKEWIKNPMNIALLLWLLCVGVSGGMLVLLLLGLLDGAFPAPASRNHWIEINNQLLNALFTLMSLYQHPGLFHHLFLLCRWRPRDVAELRAAYCSGKVGGAGARTRPGERAHMAVVVALLHLTVACQYVLCGLYWGYTKRTRPELVEDGFFVLGVVAPVVAAVYTVCSPLGRDQHGDLSFSDDSSAAAAAATVCTTEHAVVLEPEWAGGMFDCDAGGGAAALACTFCVFGWNMERLGMGNACVHAATFALLCLAPVWVLGVTALHVHDVVIADVAGGAGALLCVCGLLYGGYWRIEMRRKFALPATASTACCGSASLTDYALWLLCAPCALAQETRTASLYHVDGENFYKKISVHVKEESIQERQPLLAASRHDHELSSSRSDDQHLMAPPAVVHVVVEQTEGGEHCSVADRDDRNIDSPLPISVAMARVEDEVALLVEVDDDGEVLGLSEGRWSVDKVKKLINVVTMVSLLVLLYTRGFIR